MTGDDFIQPTPDRAVTYCPGCEPERALGAEILEARACYAHAPSMAGIDDGAIGFRPALSNSGDADGHDCRAMAKLLNPSVDAP